MPDPLYCKLCKGPVILAGLDVYAHLEPVGCTHGAKLVDPTMVAPVLSYWPAVPEWVTCDVCGRTNRVGGHTEAHDARPHALHDRLVALEARVAQLERDGFERTVIR